MVTIYEPAERAEDTLRLAVGLGSGLGVCYLAREFEHENFTVFPSESCMVKYPIYNKIEREFWSFVREVKHIERNDVEVLLGGTGPPLLFEFLAT